MTDGVVHISGQISIFRFRALEINCPREEIMRKVTLESLR